MPHDEYTLVVVSESGRQTVLELGVLAPDRVLFLRQVAQRVRGRVGEEGGPYLWFGQHHSWRESPLKEAGDA